MMTMMIMATVTSSVLTEQFINQSFFN